LVKFLRRSKFSRNVRVRGNAQMTEAESISENEMVFMTDSPLPIGTVVEVLLKMAEQVAGEPTAERRAHGTSCA
jgi:hypothetical protein